MNDWEKKFLNNCEINGQIKTLKQLKVLLKIKMLEKNNNNILKRITNIKMDKDLLKLKNIYIKLEKEIPQLKKINDWEKKFLLNYPVIITKTKKQEEYFDKIMKKIEKQYYFYNLFSLF
jgi:hypothetical protein